MVEADPLSWMAEAGAEAVDGFVATLDASERREWAWDWTIWARASQIAPPGDWRVWLVMAGRGFGKTRSGAEWVSRIADQDPGARIALVGANLQEARAVMVEGESGLLAVGAPWRRPIFEPSLRRLVWPGGAQAMLYSAGEPESLRGPQHSRLVRRDRQVGQCRGAGDGMLGQPDDGPASGRAAPGGGDHHAARRAARDQAPGRRRGG